MRRTTASLLSVWLIAGCADIGESGKDWSLAEDAPVAANEPQRVRPNGEPIEGEVERAAEAFVHATALLDGRWTEQNVGCIQQWVWNAFEAQHVLVASEESAFGEDGDEEELWRSTGSWSIDEFGTVDWAYDVDGRETRRRQTLGVIDGPLANALTWIGGDEAVWPSGGFAPNTMDLTTLRSVEYRGSELSDGSIHEVGTTVDLELSAPLDELAAGAECHMRLVGVGLDGTEAEFAGPCSVGEGPVDGVLVVHGADFPADWGEAAQQWHDQLDADGFYASSEAAHQVDQVRVATTPALLFDPNDPTVAFRPYGMSVLGQSTP